jgi:hypothetical protein
MSFIQTCLEWAKLVEFQHYTFVVSDGHGGVYLQAYYDEPDIITGRMERQHTRKWLLSPFMVKSEFIQTAFKLVMTSMEHRAREGFLYRGKRVFGPHFDVDALHSICGELDYRKEGAGN